MGIRAANTEAAARSDFITEGSITEEAVAAYVAASLVADPVRVDWRAMAQFDALDAERISIPTLVIHGVGDPIARQLWQAKLFTRMVVGERAWVVIPGADHAAHLERPVRFMRALVSFLAPDPHRIRTQGCNERQRRRHRSRTQGCNER